MPKIMLDPSFVFSDEGQALLQDGEARDRIVISDRFRLWLEDPREIDAGSFAAEDDLETIDRRFATVREMLGDVPPFSYREEEANLPVAASEVLRALLESPDEAAQVWADEWAFLQSHSWLLSKLRRPLRAFRDAGGMLIEVSKDKGIHFVSEVMPRVEDEDDITRGVILRAGAKWTCRGVVGLMAGQAAAAIAGGLTANPIVALLAQREAGRAGSAIMGRVVVTWDP